ncbi:hypothetical protein [Paenibacillus sonchi]|uniref:hypothetical protein n=1 Tax=Paenibacillus sonchi TaxID=373687 RepID=UPI001F3C0192|nr:hypothetical protein [Paenibacillus sonchi]
MEINGGRFRNLHLFANPMEAGAPQPDGAGVHLVQPGIHRSPDLLSLLKRTEDQGTGLPQTLYFARNPLYRRNRICNSVRNSHLFGWRCGIYRLFVCERVEDVEIRGRGVVYLADFHRFSAFRGVRIVFSRRIRVEGITVIDPPHYSIFNEPQENYWGALSINAGDGNTVRNVLYSNIRVERIEQGQLFDLRVVMNKDYNPEPGTGIEQVTFRNVSFNGSAVHPSRIYGYDEDRGVNAVEFISLQIGGEWVENTRTDLILLNAYAHNVVFKRE